MLTKKRGRKEERKKTTTTTTRHGGVELVHVLERKEPGPLGSDQPSAAGGKPRFPTTIYQDILETGNLKKKKKKKKKKKEEEEEEEEAINLRFLVIKSRTTCLAHFLPSNYIIQKYVTF